MTDLRDFIEGLIKKKIATYADSFDEVVGDYHGEIETIEGYNGRQLLELLQNCDDEGSKEVLISLDTINKTISVANNGKSFSQKGYRSLFKPHLSAKKSRRNYIGNKGLGFRSIINWSDAIEVRSNNLALIYSEKNRVEKFNKLFSSAKQAEIRQDQNLPANVVPMPFLALPEVKSIPLQDYVTTIVIHYKSNFLGRIIKQVSEITPETLLFLNHIEEVKFSGFDDVNDIVCKKKPCPSSQGKFSPKETIVNGDLTWLIFEEEGILPDAEIVTPAEESDQENQKEETTFYQIKIAIEKDLKKSVPKLYSFFPTNILLNQPYILHATFDLDSNRNQINDSKRNEFILERIAAFTVKVALYYSAIKVDYKPLKILSHNRQADTLANLGYYKMIDRRISEEILFPCIDRKYRRLADVVYISESFAALLNEINANNVLRTHLLPFNGGNFSNTYWLPLINKAIEALPDSVNLINKIGALKMDHNARSRFIAEIIKHAKFIKSKFPNSLAVLSDGNGAIINGGEYIYTPSTHSSDDKKLLVPSFTKIQFINRNLYLELLRVLDFAGNENKKKSRFVPEQLNGFCNIHSYEPMNLANKIISETNKVIKADRKHAIRRIKEMNSCLFNNYNLIDDETQKVAFKSNAPAITLNQKVKPAEELILSAGYPTGKKAEFIFNGIYSKEQFIASPKNIGLPAEADLHIAEAYLKWLNVNSFARYTKISTQYSVDNYAKFVIGNLSTTGFKATYKRIEGFEDVLKQIPLNKLLLWVHFDSELKTQMNDERNEDLVQNFYRIYHPLYDRLSFLKFQLIMLYPVKFKTLLLDEKYSWANDFQIDYQDKSFVDYGLTKVKLNEILVLMGACQEFEQLGIDRVKTIINKIPEHFKDGKKSQSLYKKALSHYKEHKRKLSAPLTLFADNGERLAPYLNNEIYFSDRIKLPKQLRKQFPVFNFPSRAGGAEAIEFFAINDLQDVAIEVVEYQILEQQTAELERYLNKLKPIILTMRINGIEKENIRREQASICNQLVLSLCSEVKYAVGENTFSVGDYEYIHVKDYTYFIKVNNHDKLGFLRRNSVFLDSFADIISLSFDLSGEKNDFKYLLRNSFEDILSDARLDFGEDTYQEARELLGLADYKQAFWRSVFECMGFHYDNPLDDSALSKLILDGLGIDFDPQSIDYEGLNKDHELYKIKALFNQLQLPLATFADVFPNIISFESVHSRVLKDVILSRKREIKAMIWSDLKNKTIEEQALFLTRINKYEQFDGFAMQQADLLRHQFEFDPEQIFEDYIAQTYGSLDRTITGNPETERQKNCKKFSKAELYDISQSERWKSLIYFGNAVEVIRTELAASKVIVGEDEAAESVQGPFHVDILNSELLNANEPPANHKNRPVFTPRDVHGRRSKEKGNRSEDIVFDYLSGQYENVDLISRDNEGLHYDIRYKSDSGSIKFVEVKSFDNGSFFLTKDEFDFGKNHTEDFEVWLVYHGQSLIPIYDFFSNPKYVRVPNEYLVYLKLERE